MKYEFQLHKERAEILKADVGNRCEIFPTDDPKFLRVELEVDSNWDILQIFHAGITAGQKAIFDGLETTPGRKIEGCNGELSFNYLGGK